MKTNIETRMQLITELVTIKNDMSALINHRDLTIWHLSNCPENQVSFYKQRLTRLRKHMEQVKQEQKEIINQLEALIVA